LTDLLKVEIIEIEYYGMLKIGKKLRFLKALKWYEMEKYN
jgi:hypothetical protein